MHKQNSYTHTDYHCDKQTDKQKKKWVIICEWNEEKLRESLFEIWDSLRVLACWERMAWNRKTKEIQDWFKPVFRNVQGGLCVSKMINKFGETEKWFC